jgi:polyribonucleotide nucleotidyltransferase
MHGVTDHSVTADIGGTPITFSTGRYAKQADGAVVVSAGESSVLCTAVCDTKPSRFDFLPLTVDFQDKDGARGVIPGGFLKREGRATERTTLICRVIDRPIRPMFPKHFRNELQVIVTTLSYDSDMETDVLGLCGASAALHISKAPMAQAIAGVRVCEVDGELALNPGFEARANSTLNIVVAGTVSAVTMVEGGANEVSEERMVEAIMLAHEAIKTICAALDELREKAGSEKLEVEAPVSLPEEIQAFVNEHGAAPMTTALATEGKFGRKGALKAARNEVLAAYCAKSGIEDADEVSGDVASAWGKLLSNQMRTAVIADGRRIDGRAPDEIRDIWCEVGIAKRAHGSAIFTRGETQGFVSAALGTEYDAQRIDWAGAYEKKRMWMLTYSFPPFCVGEARPLAVEHSRGKNK